MLIQTVIENLYRIWIIHCLVSLDVIYVFYTSQLYLYNTIGTVNNFICLIMLLLAPWW